jgi:hypothetical protein
MVDWSLGSNNFCSVRPKQVLFWTPQTTKSNKLYWDSKGGSFG